MCIIGIKDYDAPDFTEEILKNCWDRNSDGAGWASWKADKSLWEIEKGYMKWNDFLEAYKKKNFTKNDLVFVHFRIGTSGLKDGGNTHPFPVLDSVDDMRKTHILSETIAIHNGVVGNGEGVASDTIVYIRDYLFPLMAIWGDSRVSEKIADSILTKGSSRWVVAYKNTWRKYGTWHKYKDWEFSNTTYEASRVVYSTGRSTIYSYTPASPSIYAMDKDEWYYKLEKENLLPFGYYTGGAQKDEKGFWQQGSFKSWKKLYEEKSNRRLLPEPKTLASELLGFTSQGFIKHYFQSYCTKAGKNTSVINWNIFSVSFEVIRKHFSEKNTKNLIDVISDGNELVVLDSEKEAELKKQLDELKICPNCFDGDRLGDSDFNVGDTKCFSCGCVFDLMTGVIQTYDLDIYRMYSAKVN